MERDLKDAAFEITSPSLIAPAYEKNHLGELTLLQGLSPVAAYDRIAGMTTVKTGLNNTNVVEIAVQGARAEEIPQIVAMYSGNLGLTQRLEEFVLAAELLMDRPDVQFCFVGRG